MTASKVRLAFAVLVVLTLSFRLFKLDLPYVEPYNSLTRQVITAAVVRNFYEHGFNFFYPEIDANGNGPSLYNAELPIASFLMAVGYALSGGVNAWAARLVSVFFSLVGLAAFWSLVRRYYGKRVALIALFFAAVSPLHVALSRSIQPDMTMIGAGTAAMYFFEKYLRKRRASDLGLAALLIFTAVGVRIYGLYLALPLLYLAYQRDGTLAFKRPANYVFLAAMCAPLIWYFAMWKAGQSQDLLYAPLTVVSKRGGVGLNYFQLLFQAPYAGDNLKYFLFHLLTLPGAILFCLGIFTRPQSKESRFFYAWLAGTLVYYLVFFRTSRAHSYYQLPLVMPVACFAALGMERCLRSALLKQPARQASWTALIIAATLVNTLYFVRGLYYVPDHMKAVVEAGERVDRLLPTSSLVIASYASTPAQHYFCHRKGWSFDVDRADDESAISDLEKLRSQGADYFMTAHPEQLRKLSKLYGHLRQNYHLLAEEPAFILFDLSGIKS